MRKQIHFLIILFCLVPLIGVKADTINQKVNFNVESDYSVSGEIRSSATLKYVSNKAYFYFDDNWWSNLTDQELVDINKILSDLGNEFDSNIYTKSTLYYGSEWNPGVDKDSRITVLFHPMKEDAKGYFRNIDEYEKIVAPASNQREMVYLNANNIRSAFLDEFLAHEFAHLIIWNQKDRIYNAEEETWLTEARAEYLITYLGYNQKDNSYLEQRVKDFLERPTDSLSQWDNEIYDYGMVNVFANYLGEKYGQEVLSESIKTSQVGVGSIDYALTKLGKSKTFAQIFADFSVAVYINDCTLTERYCFKNSDLSNLQIIPFNNFLPLSGESSLSVSQTLSAWSAHWQKFSGARSDLKIEFDGKKQASLKVFYIIKDFSGNYELKELTLDSNKKGTIIVTGVGKDKSSIVIIPISLSSAPSAFYSITANTYTQTNPDQTQDTINPFPFEVNKPISQMNREELLSVLLRLIIYLILQGKLVL